MPSPRPDPRATRRVVAIAAAFVLASLSCGREPTAPGGGSGMQASRGISFIPQFPANYPLYLAALQAQQTAHASLGGSSNDVTAGDIAGFTQVHIVLTNPDGSVAKDTIINYSPTTGDLTLTLNVPLASTAPTTGVTLALNLDYETSTGTSVFHGGPVNVNAVPAVAGNPPPPPVSVPVTYTGTGAQATQVTITPKTRTVNTGQTFSFTAAAFDNVGNPVANAPIFFVSDNTALATVSTSGSGTAGSSRGTAHITAQLLNNASDAATLTVVAPPSALALASGSGQTGFINANLTQPIVARVTATDGLPAAGVTVNFAAGVGSGTVTPASVVTDASGNASATWKLGNTVGAQSATATSAGLTGSPVTFTATGQTLPAVKLVVQTQPPSSTGAGTPFGLVVNAVDVNNAIVPNFTGNVSIALSPGAPGGSTLNNATPVAAVAGVATFTGLSINLPGTYTLALSAAGLTGATSASMAIVPGNANKLAFLSFPTLGAVAGSVLDPITVQVRDSLGNPVTTSTALVTLAFGTSPAGATFAAGNTTANAVAGVATFTGVKLNVAGAYTLTASAAGVVSTTSPSFNITAGPASSLVLVSGGGQTAAASTAVPAFIVVKVTDAVGNGIPGVTVNFTPVAGSVTVPSIATDGAGLAQTKWTLGAAAGSQTLNVTSAGLTPNPLAITATATGGGGGGTVSSLVYSSPPSNSVAGVAMAPAITVTAKDALGATVTTFTGNVVLSLTSNPGASTLSGTLTQAAVAGVATFNNISLNKFGTGYVITATGGAVSVGSAPFNITAAAAANIALNGGNAQSALAGTALSTNLSVIVTDAFGNPVSGTTVNYATPNGGSFAPAAAVTNVAGVAVSTWTLGAAAGPQTATATSGTLTGSPVNFTANASSALANITWTGATSTAFNVASNWSPAQVPTSTDSVLIPATANNPVLSAATTLKALYLTGTASLSILANNLTITGNLDAGHTIIGGGGKVILSGTGTLKGKINANVGVTGTYAIAATDTISGNLDVTGGSLTLAGHALRVGGTFSTQGAAILVMTAPLDSMLITGNAEFSGGSTTGQLTAGTLVVGSIGQGNLGGASTAFAASGTHTTVINSVVNNGINFNNAATSTFQNLTLNPGGAGITIHNPVTANGNVTISAGAVGGNSYGMTIGGQLSDPTGALAIQSVSFTGSTNPIAAGTTTLNQLVAFNTAGTVLQGNVTVNGAVSVSSSGSLSPGGHTLTVNGSFSTNTSGTLVMQNALDSVKVTGDAIFGGGSSSGLLTNGALLIGGNFSQSGGSTTAFDASGGTHTTKFNGGAAQSVLFANTTSRFANVTFANTSGGITLASQLAAFGNVTIPAGAGAVNGAGYQFTINGTLTDPSGLLTVNTIIFASTTTPIAATTSNVNAIAVFAVGGASLAGNVTVNAGAAINAGQLNINGHKLTVTGNFATAAGGQLQMNNAADSVVVNGSVDFEGGVSLLGNGTLIIGGNFTQGTVANSFAASSPHVTKFAGATPTITFTNPTTSNFGTLQFATSGAVTLASDVATSFDVWLKTSTTPSVTGAGKTVTVGRFLYDTTGGRWLPTTTVMTGGAILPKHITSNVTITGTGGLITDSVIVTGNVLVTGASASLNMNGHYMSVSGTFGTAAGGTFQMTHASDSLVVTGAASFNGGSTAGLLTNGYVEFRSSFAQATNAAAYAADTPHETHFVDAGGPLAHGVSFANPSFTASHFGEVYFADTLTTVSSDIFANGTLETGIVAFHRLVAASDHLVTSRGADVRDIEFNNVRWLLVDGDVVTDMDFVFFKNITNTTANQFEVQRSGAISMVNFTNWSFTTVPSAPGLYIKATDTDGAVSNGALTITMVNPNPGVTGGFVAALSGAVINGWSNAATWLGIVDGNWSTAGNWSSSAVPTSAVDVVIAAAPNAPTTSASSSAHNLTINSNQTLTAMNFMSISGDLTINPGGALSIGASVAVNVNGNVTTDTAGTTGVTTCTSGNGLNLQIGTGHTITGKFCNLSIFGGYTASGPVAVVGSGTTGNFSVGGASGSLTLGGHTLSTNLLLTQSSGTLTMNNALDSVVVTGGATWNGGAETGLLSAGNLVMKGNFTVNSGVQFDATGTHTTTFIGSGTQTLAWTSATPNHGFRNVIFSGIQNKQFAGDQYITGNMTCDNTMTLGTVSGSFNIYIGGNLVDNSGIANGCWSGSASLHFTGTPVGLPPKLVVNTLTFQGGGTVSLAQNLNTNNIVVDGTGTNLKLNGHYVTTNAANFTTQNGGTLEMTNAADSLAFIGGTFAGGNENGLLTQGAIVLQSLSQTTNLASFQQDSTARTYIGTGCCGSMSFSNPSFANSHVGYLIINSGSTITFNTDVYVQGKFVAAQAVQNVISGANTLITALGATITKLTNTGVRLLFLDGNSITQLDNMVFSGMSTTVHQLEFQRTGSGVTGTVPTLNNPKFNTAPTTGAYISATGASLTINLSGQTPSTVAASTLSASGGAVINWPSVLTLATTGNWSVASNWSPAIVPDSFAAISIPAGKTASLSGTGTFYAKDITVAAGGLIAMGTASLEAHGSIVADTAQGQGFSCTANTASFQGILYQPDQVTGTVTGRFCRYHSGGAITMSGPMVVDSVWHVHDGTFTFNGKYLRTKEGWIGAGANGVGNGGIVMSNAADSLVTTDSLLVNPVAATANTLSAGTVIVGTHFRQSGNLGGAIWAAGVSHITKLTGPGNVFFTDTTTSNFGTLFVGGVSTFSSVAKVKSNLTLTAAAAKITGTSGRVKLSGNLTGRVGSTIDVKGFELGGVYADSGTFNPDTAVFTGAGQVIPDSVVDATTFAVGGPTFKSIRVTGTATMTANSAQNNWNIAGKIIVDGGQLRIGNGNSIFIFVNDSLITKNGGTLKMIDAASTMHVVKSAIFSGGSTTGLLTNGTLDLGANLFQSGSSTSFAPSNSHTTVLAGTNDTVSFANPTTSGFQNLTVFNTTIVSLASDAYATGTLVHSVASGAAQFLATAGTTRLLTVGGMTNGPTYPFNFNNVGLKFVDGTTNVSFSNINFSGFPATYGGTMFEVARTTGGPFTFNALNFTGTLSATGLYLLNSGSQSVILTSIVPGAGTGAAAAACGCSTFQTVTGTGSITWP